MLVSKTSPSGIITPSGDVIEVALVKPDGMPAMVRIVWPPQPTMIDPRRFPDTAATVAQLFVRAHIVLAALKAHGK
jgi:hypothetical protein